MFLSTCLDENNLDQNEQFLLQFILEKLQLISISKTGRRYSVSMLKTCFLWQFTSTCLYEKLCNFLLLPSRSLLQQLSSPMNVDSHTIDLNYLKARITELTPKECVFVLLIDEVYTAQRKEYSDGSFISLTIEGKPAKTVLVFMVQSVVGNFKDIFCLVPINKLDTALLHHWLNVVLSALDTLCSVVAISVDNHVCNR